MKQPLSLLAEIQGAGAALESHKAQGERLRKRLGVLLAEARDHPELTLEEGRQAPEVPIPRQTANRLIKAAQDEAGGL